jgi:hypothetical protein
MNNRSTAGKPTSANRSFWAWFDRLVGNDGTVHYWTNIKVGDLCACGHGRPLTGNRPHVFKDTIYGHRWRIPACCTIRFIWDSFFDRPSGSLRGAAYNEHGVFVPCGVLHK